MEEKTLLFVIVGATLGILIAGAILKKGLDRHYSKKQQKQWDEIRKSFDKEK